MRFALHVRASISDDLLFEAADSAFGRKPCAATSSLAQRPQAVTDERGRARVPTGRPSIRDRLRAPCPSDRAGNSPEKRSGVGHENPLRTPEEVERPGN